MFKPLPPTNVERTIIRQLFPGSLEYINAKFLDAARRGDVETLKTCLGHCIDINTVNVNYLTALHHATSEAVHEGHYEVVKLLLQRGANFNMRGGLGIDLYTAEEGLNRYPPQHNDIKIKILNLLKTASHAFNFLHECYLQWEKQQENLVIEISPDFFSYLQNFPEFMELVYFPPRQSDKNFIEINEESVEDLEKLLAKQSIFTTKSPIFSPQL